MGGGDSRWLLLEMQLSSLGLEESEACKDLAAMMVAEVASTELELQITNTKC